MKKKITLIFMLCFLFTIIFTGCGKEKEFENPYFSSETSYLSGKQYVRMYIYNYGTIYMVLDADVAPVTVTNFINLVDMGFYNGLTFHRVVNDFMIQGGDPDADGTGGSVYNIPGEFALNGHENSISHVRGTVSMARAEDYDSASSQFFIVQADTPALDGSYAAFGTVVHGMEIVDAICEQTPVKDSNGLVDKTKQPILLIAETMSEQDFKQLESQNFTYGGTDTETDTDADTETEEKKDFALTMDMAAADHGKTVVATWPLNTAAETYLISATHDIKNISLYEADVETLDYNKDKLLYSHDNLLAGELIEAKLLVPEGIPAHVLLVTHKTGDVTRYLVCYDGRTGGVSLSPLNAPVTSIE